MRNERRMRTVLLLLRIFIILNVALFIFLLYNKRYWVYYAIINGVFILGYVWFNLIRLFICELNEDKKIVNYLGEGVGYSVVIPFYNEEPGALVQGVKSILAQDDNYRQEIIIVDDGSNSPDSYNSIQELKKEYPYSDITIIRYDNNRGKRYAHCLAFQKAKYDFIVSMDSDTTIDQGAIAKALSPFVDSRVGATTGNIIITNEKENLLTRLQGSIYYIGLRINKKSQSYINNVFCCSGCFSIYRKDKLLDILDEYYNQTFLGHKCTVGEDRHLTNLIKYYDNKIVFVEDAYSRTIVPNRISKYLNQQIRWKRSFYRENIFILTYAWRKSSRIFFIETFFLIFNVVINLSFRLMVIYLFFFNPIIILTTLLPAWVLYNVCVNSLLYLEKPSKGIFFLLNIFVYNFIVYFLNIYAIFRPIPKSWGTR